LKEAGGTHKGRFLTKGRVNTSIQYKTRKLLYLNILKSEKNFPHFPHSPHFPITFTIKCKKSTLVRAGGRGQKDRLQGADFNLPAIEDRAFYA
jgi:hypothetical protein